MSEASLSVGGSEKADAGSDRTAATTTEMLDVATTKSTSTLFPVVDLTPLLLLDDNADDDDSLLLAASKQIAASLVATGCVLVKDPRVSEEDNDRFLDLLERYFEQPEALKREDARPELHYQVGATPEGIERPSMLTEDSTSAARARNLVERINERKEANSNLSDFLLPTWPRGADPKWRVFWRVGPRPAATAFPELNAPQVVPREFAEEWAETLDG